MKQGAKRQTIGLPTLAVALGFPSQHKMWLTTSAAASLQVTHRDARGRHTFERHTKAAADLFKQARQRLAAIAELFRAVRAIKNRIDPATHSGQHFVHFGVHSVQRCHIKQATA